MGVIKKYKVVEKGVVDVGRFSAPVEPSSDFIELPKQDDLQKDFEAARIRIERQNLVEDSVSEEESIEKAYDNASKIIEQAQSEANDLISNANAEADEIRQSAREEGFQEGFKEGQQQVADLINQAMETLNEAIKQRDKIIKDAESEIVRLALKIAEKVIRTEVTTNKEVVQNIVSEAISRVSDRENIIIKVNEKDLEFVKQNKDKIAGIIDGVKNLSIIEDSQVEPGGCVIETNLGFVDARISTKISLIEKSLQKVSESESD